MTVELCVADYENDQHARDLIYLLNAYACDPQGGGEELNQVVKERLVDELAKRPHAFSVLAYVDSKPGGLANCFDGFSTFACKPLVNIHDLVVHPEFRGQGISQALLNKIEEIAVSKGCCKITLEVLEYNGVAQSAYKKFGFAPYQLDEQTGRAQFWQKSID